MNHLFPGIVFLLVTILLFTFIQAIGKQGDGVVENSSNEGVENGTSHSGRGMPCVIPEDFEKIKTRFIHLSEDVIADWEMREVNVGCSGSISASYFLPAFSNQRIQ